MKTLFGLVGLFLFAQAHGNEISAVKTFKMSKEVNKSVLVEGTIANVYQCPPCPEGAMCKPCDRPNFTLKDLSSAETITVYIHPESTLSKDVKEAMGIKIYLHRKTNEMIYGLPAPYLGEAYYQTLRQKCAKKPSDSCCLSSIQNMQMIDASEAPETGCPPYSTRDTLKCKDSLKWCY
ncbi:MAG: hypothetical protein A2X86_09000 [Bdellovibrionales bacterium GWA2_49_15]|nr:MAG: hypothetical protein A2X86_09000 [Bdellovibrionales bacterium GWA2_49_15]HAZ12915.1 hypothetical protein [Bdellovibrionales bacterium]